MKYIKWFLLSSFLILFLGFCQIVNAETCTLGNEYTNELASVLNNQFQANLGNNAWTVNFNKPIQFNGNDMQYVKFYLHYEIRNVNDVITNINLNQTCGQHTTIPDNESYTITYADGTKATISGQGASSICRDYNTSGSAIYNYQPNINMVHLVIIRDDDKYIPCDVDKNGIAKCPIEGNHSYKAFRYYITLSEGSNVTISIGIITRNVPKCSNDSQETNKQLQDMNENITSTDISGASQDQSNIVNNPAFKDSTGLSGIITAPLSMISSLTNQCQPIQLSLPYLKDTNVSIPCMGNFLQSKVPALVTLIKVFVNGFICYLIGLDLFKIVKNARDPDNDRIEVLDL